jgi:hypothetical protein
MHKRIRHPGVVALTVNLSPWEAEAGRFLSSRSAWSSQDSQGYTEKPCLKKKKKKKKKNNADIFHEVIGN